jgi:hypothetical protein
MQPETRAEWKVTFFKIIPLMLVAGALIFGLQRFISGYLGTHIPRFFYVAITIVAVVVINNKYNSTTKR